MPKSERNPVVWSGVSCPFRRAGVYYGISEAGTHYAAARLLLPRRGQVYAGASAVVRAGERAMPLVYFAVRDPSAVRVVPVRNGAAGGRGDPGESDSDHVRLVFEPPPHGRPARPVNGALAALEMLKASDGLAQAVFVVTIGLRTELERRFFDEVIRAVPYGSYSEICERITRVKDTFCD